MKLAMFGLFAFALAGCATTPTDTINTAAEERPAYLVVLGTVHDRDAFMAGYAAKLGPVYEKFGGEYVVLGNGAEVLEGEKRFESQVISRWPSMAAARAFWSSPEYEALKRARLEGGWGDFDVYLMEGLPVSAE